MRDILVLARCASLAAIMRATLTINSADTQRRPRVGVVQPPGGAAREKHPFLSNGSPMHTRSADPLRGGGWTPEADARGTRPQEWETGPLPHSPRYRCSALRRGAWAGSVSPKALPQRGSAEGVGVNKRGGSAPRRRASPRLRKGWWVGKSEFQCSRGQDRRCHHSQ